MQALNKRLHGTASNAAIDAAKAIINDLTTTTPIDEGTAVSNWQVSLDAPDLHSIEAFAPSPRGRMIDGVWTHTVPPEITRAANVPLVLAAAEAQLFRKQPGQMIYISNNEPYIQRLNDGSSLQAPAGFVDRAVIIGRTTVDKIRVLV
jgi:hypothetical protein